MTRGVETDRSELPTVFVVERNSLLRDCLARCLERDLPARTTACGCVADLASAEVESPGSMVVLSLATLTESEAEQELRDYARVNGQTHLVVLAKSDDLDAVLASLGAGASGHISLSAGLPAFVEVLRFVSAGGTYVPPQSLVDAKQARAPAAPAVSGITRREFAVIEAIRRGKPNKQIAYELSMCENTVKVHVRNVMRKLHVHNRTEIAIMGARIEAE